MFTIIDLHLKYTQELLKKIPFWKNNSSATFSKLNNQAKSNKIIPRNNKNTRLFNFPTGIIFDPIVIILIIPNVKIPNVIPWSKFTLSSSWLQAQYPHYRNSSQARLTRIR
jgi:hypothetical protein